MRLSYIGLIRLKTLEEDTKFRYAFKRSIVPSAGSIPGPVSSLNSKATFAKPKIFKYSNAHRQ